MFDPNSKNKSTTPRTMMNRDSMMGYYNDVLSTSYYNTSACKDAAGPAANPLEFPTPTVTPCVRRNTIQVYDYQSGQIHEVGNVIMIPNAQHAYLVRGKVAKSTYGVIRQCVVLKRRSHRDRLSAYGDVEWESTGKLVAIKFSSWSRINQLSGRHLEDPVKEISAMQLVGDYHPNVLGGIEVLQDDNYLYTVMPYCSGGDLFGHVIDEKNHPPGEDKARAWFRQLLYGLMHFQLKGVCHRDLSLENIMVDDEGNLVIIDMGMALRVPYTDPANMGCVTDVSEGTERRLIVPQSQGGKIMYMAPEVIASEGPFDGFAVDLWAAGVILFVLLVGMAPFKWAHESDKRYAKIAKGELKELLSGHHITLSPDACDLLQNMFWQDPSKRLSLVQVLRHPWVTGKSAATPHGVPKPTMVHAGPLCGAATVA